ncbi:DUF6191 domain-containing protein [Streptomyces sp. NPDC026206]
MSRCDGPGGPPQEQDGAPRRTGIDLDSGTARTAGPSGR